MKTLFIEERGSAINYERSVLLIYKQGVRVASVPLKSLERVVLSPSVTIEAGVMGVLMLHRIDLLVFNSRFPERCAMLLGREPRSAHRRVAQYEMHSDAELRASYAHRLIYLKLQGQRRLARRIAKARPDLRYEAHQLERHLSKSCNSLIQQKSTISLPSLRGVEGAAAAAYFHLYTRVFAKHLGFIKRIKRPPTDPVNVVLSLTYTMTYHETISALKGAGLDPCLGFLHEVCAGRESLAGDIMEPVRPMIDEWVWTLFRAQTLRVEDFKITSSACKLQPEGKKRFYNAWLKKSKGLRKLLRRAALLSANEVEEYLHV